MKRNAFFCLCLCICLLFSACGTPVPEGSSVPAEESSETVSVPEDPNARIARAYLEELLEAEWSPDWLTAERAESIRESVKQLKAPFLTEEDVLALAERAAAVYLAAWQGKREILLPDCGVLAALYITTDAPIYTDPLYTFHACAYNALLAYTLYLFTPPEYVFWGAEIWNEGWYPSGTSEVDPAHALCLPFAGEYTNRSGALTAIREQQRCIRLYPWYISGGERPLDFTLCGTADLLRGVECVALELDEMMAEGSPFRRMRALEYLEPLLQRCTYIEDPRPPIEWQDETVCIPFFPDVVRTVRKMAELLPSPLLTEGDVRAMVTVFHEDASGIRNIREYPFLLPGADGEENILLQPDQGSMNWRMRRVIAYTVRLFTPSAYRCTDLFDQPGTYYALDGEDAGYVLVTGRYELYLVDMMGGMEPLYLDSGEPWE